ncbi:unnamed protein product, partial [Musa acuminata subsp. burmannicoides]
LQTALVTLEINGGRRKHGSLNLSSKHFSGKSQEQKTKSLVQEIKNKKEELPIP